MTRWFRFYDDSVNDPKLLRLPDDLYRAWTILLCFASKNEGILPAADDIAVALRIKPSKVCEWITKLVRGGLIDDTGNGFAPHNWNGRQYKSDEAKTGKGKDSYVYVIGKAWGSEALKIGFSKNPWARIVELQTAHHEKLSVLATFKCKSHSEVDIHDLLKQYRKGGEWFSLPTNIYVAMSSAAERSSNYENLVVELRELLRSTTTEAEQKQTTEQSRADARPAVSNSEKVLRTDLAEILGPTRQLDLARTTVWLSKGYSSTMIFDVVKEVLARGTNVANLAYFDAMLAERHSKRQETPSERAESAAKIDMDKVAEMFKKTGVWSRYAGPEPGMIGCRCPAEILRKHGIGFGTQVGETMQ